MPHRSFLVFLFLLSAVTVSVSAQIIHGEVYDDGSKKPMPGVTIANIYTSLDVTTGEAGTFLIAAASGQLLEFRRQGYKTTRVRIPNGYIPSYFKIALQKGYNKLPDNRHDTRYNYKTDSMADRDMYKHELDFPKMSAIDMLASPFTAMSSHNREIWKFQEEYEQTEKEKYVDKTFNSELINRFTGLTGDSLKRYMIRYRPEYEQLRGMSDYTFFNYIKQTAQYYRHPQAPRGSQ